MQKQTPKWLEHFITAFGPKGLVALAWWAGAFHAERIRSLQQAYPILHLTAEAGAGRSTLLNNLGKLAGNPYVTSFDVGHMSPSALHRLFATAGNQPTVLEAFDAKGAAQFEQFPVFYEGGCIYHNGRGYEPVEFRGALALVGGADAVSDSRQLRSRVIHIHLTKPEFTEASRAAVNALDGLSAIEADNFLVPVLAARDLVMFRLGQTQAYIDSLREDMGEALGLREARNHAQIRCLLDVLHDIGLLPDSSVMAAHAEVCEMAWDYVSTPF